MNQNKIIVSMTSYPKRIMYVSIVVNELLRQSRIPDEIHLWLAEPEFPEREKELPIELRNQIDNGIVCMHWLPKNTYIHKRHEIFKSTCDDDLVFFFDDDIIYPCNLIEEVVNTSSELDHTAIINYNKFHVHRYVGKKIVYSGVGDCQDPYKVMWCGHSMIPSKVYPKFVLDESYAVRRDILSPVSEECWLQPWLVWCDTPIVCMNFRWGKEIVPGLDKNGTRLMFYERDEATRMSYKDKCLYSVLQEYPFILEKYKNIFHYDGQSFV